MSFKLNRESGESGMLLHISSLPSEYGIGALGEEARSFVRYLAARGCTYWQVLPCGVTGYGDSPYQSASSFAGNPYFVDLGDLIEDGLLNKCDLLDLDFGSNAGRVDYYKLYLNRHKALEGAVCNFFKRGQSSEYNSFLQKNRHWLEDYALYAAIKESYGGAPFYSWEEGLKNREPSALLAAAHNLSHRIDYFRAVQFFFFKQWERLKQYASNHNIKIIGDMPFYTAHDCAEVWAQPQFFRLDEQLMPRVVAGVPPDYFSAKGQLWGNPIYDWNEMRADGYSLWKRRIDLALERFDAVRIDHFRAFSGYYVIDASAKDARGGHWERGEGLAFFEALNLLNDSRIFAEDLGVQDNDLVSLLAATGFYGMRVVQFAFSQEAHNMHLKENINHPCIYYAGGTHDNPTTNSWYSKASAATRTQFCAATQKGRQSAARAAIKYALSSNAAIVIVPMQDYLSMHGGRMNRPSSKKNNWTWRIKHKFEE